jgi:hypothetical protein
MITTVITLSSWAWLAIRLLAVLGAWFLCALAIGGIWVWIGIRNQRQNHLRQNHGRRMA